MVDWGSELGAHPGAVRGGWGVKGDEASHPGSRGARLQAFCSGGRGGEQAVCLPVTRRPPLTALLQKYLDNYEPERQGSSCWARWASVGTAVMAMFAKRLRGHDHDQHHGRRLRQASPAAPPPCSGSTTTSERWGGRAPEGRPRPRAAGCGRLCGSHQRAFCVEHFLPTSSLHSRLACGLPGTECVCVWSKVDVDFTLPQVRMVTASVLSPSPTLPSMDVGGSGWGCLCSRPWLALPAHSGCTALGSLHRKS